MPAETSANLQEVFLGHLVKNKVPLTVFLVNGVKLQGTLTRFDNFSIMLTRDTQSQLIYKAAISTIMPAGSVQLHEADAEPEPAMRRPVVEIGRR